MALDQVGHCIWYPDMSCSNCVTGLFGRLDKNSWFRTTVTRVDPTAKQSWILHPYVRTLFHLKLISLTDHLQCHRIYSVRELARSQGFPDHFRFHSENGDIQIVSTFSPISTA